jgi:pimeloyl-ACP methyl ester carboxylesterase
LKQTHQLILIDARGHGASDKPLDPSCYSAELMAGDVLAVLRELGISQVDFWGYSLGALVGLSMLQYAPKTLRSLIAGGYTPYANYTEKEAEYLAYLRAGMVLAVEHGMEAWIKAVEAEIGAPLPPLFRARFARNEPRAVLSCFDAALSWPGVGGILKSSTLPCLLYCGDLDAFHPGVQKAAQELPNAEFVSLPGLDHVGAMVSPDLILPSAARFLAQPAPKQGFPPS